MTLKLEPAPVRKSITVDAGIERAFEVFTEGFGRWWPASHSIGKSKLMSAVMEPRAGGRWYEIGEDGAECDWGEVLQWEKPNLIVLAWRIGADWRYDPSLLTEVEVRFTAISEHSTRLDLEHRLLENMGEQAEAASQALGSEGGWPGLLAIYRAELARAG